MLYLRSLAHDPFGDGANGNRNRKVGIHIQPGQCGRRLDDKYRVVTCLPPPQSSAVESGRLDSIIARFCPSGGSAGTFATVSATSGLMHRVVAEWASSVRVHARCDLSLFPNTDSVAMRYPPENHSERHDHQDDQCNYPFHFCLPL